jgi:hypothetical protein
MGGRDLINRAKSWVKGSSDIGKLALENANLLKENEGQRVTIESLEGKVRELQRMLQIKESDKEMDTEVYSQDVPHETISAADILDDPEPVVDPKRELEELKAEYQKRYGRRAHPRTTVEKLRAKLGT